jgi:hypothetical protein
MWQRPIHRPIAWLLALAVVAVLPGPGRQTAVASGAELTGGTRYLLDPEGRILGWNPDDGGLTELESPGGLPVNDLAVLAEGELLVLVQGGAPVPRHRKSDGTALLLAPSPTGLREVAEFHFPGQGFKAAVSPDGRWAYVVAYRADPRAGTAQGRTWVHILDLRQEKIIDSAALPRLPNAIAIDPHGDRLYLSLVDRILTYTTDPLASSWQYRSPGINRGLSFVPGSATLLALRPRALALFDPAVIAARNAEDRRGRADDASSLIPLSIDAAALLCPARQAPVIAYGHGGLLAFIDPIQARVIDGPPPERVMLDARLVRPIPPEPDDGAVRFAAFPPGTVVRISLPELATSPAAPSPSPESTPVPTPPAPMATPEAPPSAPTPEATPPPVTAPPAATPEETPAPAPPTPAPSPQPAPTAAPILTGRIEGKRALVAWVIVYGPDSIVKERARAAPGKDGVWEIPLPPPGVYRILPVGAAGRAIDATPSFRTVSVEDATGRTGLDFRIEAR